MEAAVGQQSVPTRDDIAGGNLLLALRYSQSGDQRDTTRHTDRLGGVDISGINNDAADADTLRVSLRAFEYGQCVRSRTRQAYMQRVRLMSNSCLIRTNPLPRPNPPCFSTCYPKDQIPVVKRRNEEHGVQPYAYCSTSAGDDSRLVACQRARR